MEKIPITPGDGYGVNKYGDGGDRTETIIIEEDI